VPRIDPCERRKVPQQTRTCCHSSPRSGGPSHVAGEPLEGGARDADLDHLGDQLILRHGVEGRREVKGEDADNLGPPATHRACAAANAVVHERPFRNPYCLLGRASILRRCASRSSLTTVSRTLDKAIRIDTGRYDLGSCVLVSRVYSCVLH
jgi:hypothetical protein